MCNASGKIAFAPASIYAFALSIAASIPSTDFASVLAIIKKLVEKYNIPVTVKGCEIFREESGLAYSSRNARLKTDYKNAAPFIFETLAIAKDMFGTKSAKVVTEWVTKQFEKQPLLELEYIIIADIATLKPVNRKSTNKTYRAFIAVYAGDIRLIDNIALN